MSPAPRADQSVVFGHEGGIRTDGYTIQGSSGSGVTIGAGVDLGYQSAASLANLGMSQDGISTLTPYLGLTGQTAINMWNSTGAPVISLADATAISNGMFNQNLGIAVGRFDQQSAIPFANLPEPAQTVIADMAYLHPSLWDYPNFWQQITSGQWLDAANNLASWTTGGSGMGQNRYNDLATRLANAVSQDVLPSDAGTCSP